MLTIHEKINRKTLNIPNDEYLPNGCRAYVSKHEDYIFDFKNQPYYFQPSIMQMKKKHQFYFKF